ncbi:unnamed protein product [Trifolium pratense]|uniref:Uncharacterized protein n=1 Tax=Trifolium pratense TaxID=57577 RepID=A0ACB0MBY6_TRIPR|nr:unnamed protein product [Trifolium pratense]
MTLVPKCNFANAKWIVTSVGLPYWYGFQMNSLRKDCDLRWITLLTNSLDVCVVINGGNRNESQDPVWYPTGFQRNSLRNDRCMWPGNGNGNFTVASAYHLLQSDVDNESMHVHCLDVICCALMTLVPKCNFANAKLNVTCVG